ncbi:uncharacterized protein BO87DRAFT_376129 [Aspergillus neoniger CBS 115656]|uniref:Uncharacterized protein n=1 Tax=Aspergillus neoniger (strain CBS 115656) TaxID=1448310 RepID=A0A318YKZ6_ASPNB|nr:hypothetical protein BO87DRAFT_376129 [Aspergillus neoniger CBS 115656]PYH34784.1 hypothetical protein BO87DRAFT_376129 [Aspergillus neoniger CBS 115656]
MPRTVLQDYLDHSITCPNKANHVWWLLSSHGSVRDDRRSRSPILQGEQDMDDGRNPGRVAALQWSRQLSVKGRISWSFPRALTRLEIPVWPWAQAVTCHDFLG